MSNPDRKMVRMGMEDEVLASSTHLNFEADAKNPWPYIAAKRSELIFRWRVKYGGTTKPKIRVYFIIDKDETISIIHPRVDGNFILNEEVMEDPRDFLCAFMEAYEFREKIIHPEEQPKIQQPDPKPVEEFKFRRNKGGLSLFSR